MNKTIALCAALALLGGCRNATNVGVTDAWRINFGGVAGYGYVSIFTDPQTGCDYFMTDDGFLSPRLQPDGSHFCRTGLKPPTPTITAPAP